MAGEDPEKNVDRRRWPARGQKLGDQPDGQDRHQDQADAVDGGGDRAVALARLDIVAAIPDAEVNFETGGVGVLLGLLLSNRDK